MWNASDPEGSGTPNDHVDLCGVVKVTPGSMPLVLPVLERVRMKQKLFVRNSSSPPVWKEQKEFFWLLAVAPDGGTVILIHLSARTESSNVMKHRARRGILIFQIIISRF